MAAIKSPSMSNIPPDGFIPPLEPGDRLTRAEFERRYEAMPKLKKAELIEGAVYMPSPVRFVRHAERDQDLNTWLGLYRAGTPGVRGGGNATTRLDLSNEPQPDGLLFIEPSCGGQVRISEDDYIEGGPELVGEVAASGVSIALHDKLEVYRRNGVREYIVWRVLDRAIDWFALRGEQYASLIPGVDGIICSEVFPGLWLDPAALAGGDLARVLAVVQQGLVSAEHAAFVARLQRAAASPGSYQAK
jgi:hypothetical protein